MSNEAKLMKLLISLDENMRRVPLLVALRRGMTAMIPLLLVGSFALVLLSLPIPPYQDRLSALFGDAWGDPLLFIRSCTFGIMALLMVITVSYAYALEYRDHLAVPVNPVIVVSVAVAGFSGMAGMNLEGFSVTSLGTMGVFSALVTAVLSTVLFLNLSRLRRRFLWTLAGGADSAFQQAVLSVLPAAATLMVLAAVQLLLVRPSGFANLNGLLSSGLLTLFSHVAVPLGRGLLFMLSIHGLWWVGIHGNNALEPVAQLLFVPGQALNSAQAAAGGLPTDIFTKTFFDTFVLMGGCGSTLTLLAAILLFGRYRNTRRIAHLSLVPVLFNINELIVFGLPIVLNPVYLIPFIGVPLLLTLISWGAMALGLVPLTAYPVEWTTPVLLSGYAATHSLAGSLLQLFNLAVGALCYAPFVRVAEAVAGAQMREDMKKLNEIVRHSEERGVETALLARYDDVGTIARFLSADLEAALAGNRLQLHYQPQHDDTGAVIGAEALLRWHHEAYGWIYPPLIVALAEEAGLMKRLGPWILEKASQDLQVIRQQTGQDLTVSVNVTARQMEDRGCLDTVRGVLETYGIAPERLVLELTERLALASGSAALGNIQALKALGVKLAMDDFGMGHSSLMYLKEYHFDEVKLDGALIRELYDNPSCSSIIRSIVLLGESLHYRVIAEYVEEERQREMLLALGCRRYQGYLFSPALPLEELMPYLLRHPDQKAS